VPSLQSSPPFGAWLNARKANWRCGQTQDQCATLNRQQQKNELWIQFRGHEIICSSYVQGSTTIDISILGHVQNCLTQHHVRITRRTKNEQTNKQTYRFFYQDFNHTHNNLVCELEFSRHKPSKDQYLIAAKEFPDQNGRPKELLEHHQTEIFNGIKTTHNGKWFITAREMIESTPNRHSKALQREFKVPRTNLKDGAACRIPWITTVMDANTTRQLTKQKRSIWTRENESESHQRQFHAIRSTVIGQGFNRSIKHLRENGNENIHTKC